MRESQPIKTRFRFCPTASKKTISEFDDVRATVQQQYNTLLVDEYQDTNLLQAQLLKNLNTGSNITVVGDDAQSIYSFRAARIENILEFPEEFNAERITLDINTDALLIFSKWLKPP